MTPRASGEFPLVRVRNPWGNEVEWKGAWADGSPEWSSLSDQEKKRLGLNFEADGEFWMSYEDWRARFDLLEMTNLSPDSPGEDSPGHWAVATFSDSWQAGLSAGGCRNFLETFADNPQFLVSLTEQCSVLVNLIQKGRRAMKDEGRDLLPVGFSIYSLGGQEKQGRCPEDFFKYNRIQYNSKFGKFRYGSMWFFLSLIFDIFLRDVSGRFKLPPGNYLIIPSTFKPNQEGDFMLRVFTEQPVNSIKL